VLLKSPFPCDASSNLLWKEQVSGSNITAVELMEESGKP